MRTILCFGDSNTWGAPPSLPSEELPRFPPHVRWPGVLAEQLGEDHQVIENGLCGRTTCYRDPVQGAWLSGLDHLPVSLLTHDPLDLVILMLGTNDLKSRFNADARTIANNVGTLVETVWAHSGEELPVLVICPPQAKKVSIPRSPFAGADARSEAFPREFARMAVEKQVSWIDAGEFVVSSDLDGIHLEANAHRLLGEVVTDKVRTLL